ncbi:MAG: phosphotransacetylase family protein [Anaerolineae bacterium]|nr:phosphotransacetylase family protein [Anaerolineae bacterium]
MKALYITSIEPFSGKTAVCLALGRRFKREGYEVGYFKPLSTQPWEPVPGRALDEDADFVRRTLDLPESTEELIGILLTPSLAREMRCGCTDRDLMSEVQAAYEKIQDKDIVLIEGGGSLREGVSLGLDPKSVTEILDVQALAIVRYHNRVNQGDDCITAYRQLYDQLIGTMINAVPRREQKLSEKICTPCLEKQGIRVLGTIPFQEELQAISVDELAEVLNAEFLTLPEKGDVLIERLIVGAMGVDQALPRIRRIAGAKALITGGDRSDMQLVGLEAATRCLILTGNLRPMPEVLRRAEEFGVPVLLVRQNTLETVEAIEAVFGKTRLGQESKLQRFEDLFAENFDLDRLYDLMGLS